jgi:hypothetical protein
MRHVTLENVKVFYHGADVILEDVSFVKCEFLFCEFLFDNGPRERALSSVILGATKVDFRSID